MKINAKQLIYMGLDMLLDQAKKTLKNMAEKDERESLKKEIIDELMKGGFDGRKDA